MMNLKTFFEFKKAYSGHFLWPLVLHTRRQTFKQIAIEAAQSSAKGLLLDIGTGSAHLPIEIARDCIHTDVVGIDISSRLLHEAAKSIKNKPYKSRIHLVVSFAEQLPFIDNSFDVVQSMFSFHLWDDQRLGIQEIFRVLKPGRQASIFVGRQHLLYGLWKWFYFLTTKPTSELRDMCVETGFREVEILPFKPVNGGIKILLTK